MSAEPESVYDYAVIEHMVEAFKTADAETRAMLRKINTQLLASAERRLDRLRLELDSVERAVRLRRNIDQNTKDIP